MYVCLDLDADISAPCGWALYRYTKTQQTNATYVVFFNEVYVSFVYHSSAISSASFFPIWPSSQSFANCSASNWLLNAPFRGSRMSLQGKRSSVGDVQVMTARFEGVTEMHPFLFICTLFPSLCLSLFSDFTGCVCSSSYAGTSSLKSSTMW